MWLGMMIHMVMKPKYPCLVKGLKPFSSNIAIEKYKSCHFKELRLDPSRNIE